MHLRTAPFMYTAPFYAQPVRFLETNMKELERERKEERVCVYARASERLLRARALRCETVCPNVRSDDFFSRRYWTRCTSISQGFTWCGPTTSWSFPTPRSGVTFSRRRNSSRWPPIRTRRWVKPLLWSDFLFVWKDGGERLQSGYSFGYRDSLLLEKGKIGERWWIELWPFVGREGSFARMGNRLLFFSFTCGREIKKFRGGNRRLQTFSDLYREFFSLESAQRREKDVDNRAPSSSMDRYA